MAHLLAARISQELTTISPESLPPEPGKYEVGDVLTLGDKGLTLSTKPTTPWCRERLPHDVLRPGHAQAAHDTQASPRGTLIGQALESLPDGRGKVRVRVGKM